MMSPGSARPCIREAMLAASPTTASSCTPAGLVIPPISTTPVAIPIRTWTGLSPAMIAAAASLAASAARTDCSALVSSALGQPK